MGEEELRKADELETAANPEEEKSDREENDGQVDSEEGTGVGRKAEGGERRAGIGEEGFWAGRERTEGEGEGGRGEKRPDATVAKETLERTDCAGEGGTNEEVVGGMMLVK